MAARKKKRAVKHIYRDSKKTKRGEDPFVTTPFHGTGGGSAVSTTTTTVRSDTLFAANSL